MFVDALQRRNSPNGIIAFFVAGLTDSAWIGGLSGVAALFTVVLVLRWAWGPKASAQYDSAS